jgi:hypothetical protein
LRHGSCRYLGLRPPSARRRTVIYDRITELVRLIEDTASPEEIEIWRARSENLKAKQEAKDQDLRERVRGSVTADINFGGMSGEYDNTIRGLTPDGERQVKYAKIWRAMTDEQKAAFRRRMIDEGIVDEADFDTFVCL